MEDLVLRASPESPRMFESDFVDGLTRVPAWVVPLIYVPIAAGHVAFGAFRGEGAAALTVQFVIGWVVWTLMEYWLHRTVFHWVPARPWGERFHFYVHGVHHEWFRDKYRLVMPPAASLAVTVVVVTLLKGVAFLGAYWLAPTWVYAFFAGIATGYMVYDLTHYYIHHFRPVTSVGLALRTHHNKHHHNPAYANKKFGVSTTLWDHVFGTYE